MTSPATTTEGPSSGEVADTVVAILLHAGVEQFIGVPDSQLADVLLAVEREMPVTYTTREDVAVAMAVGAELTGHHHAVFMKNAGLGASMDALISVAIAASVPLTVVVGWAGAGRDTLEHHVVMGERTAAMLVAAGMEYGVVGAGQVVPACLAGRLVACRADGRTFVLLVEP